MTDEILKLAEQYTYGKSFTYAGEVKEYMFYSEGIEAFYRAAFNAGFSAGAEATDGSALVTRRAFACFAPNGDVRFWSQDCEQSQKFSAETGVPLVPLYELKGELK